MPSIKFTTKLATYMGDSQGITAAATTGPSFARALVADSDIVSRIRIMSGPVPTQEELDVMYPTSDRFTGSPTETLIESQTRASSYFDSIDGIITWDLKVATAVSSGTASWWVWSGNEQYNPIDRGAAPGAPDDFWLGCIMGDITLLGGGGSMTLVDTEIVQGQSYEIGPASFVMPRTYTYT